MGIEAVIFVLVAVIAAMAIQWRANNKDRETELAILRATSAFLKDSLADEQKRNVALESELRRVRNVPVMPRTEKDDSVIKARSAAQVRQITETAFGKQPDLKDMN